MAYFDAGFWSHHIRRVFIPQTRAFERAVVSRVMPAFEHIEEEAEQLQNEEYERLMRLPGDDSIDPATLAEMAQDSGIGHYEELTAVRQAILNMSAAAL